jgi:hypothetical protein
MEQLDVFQKIGGLMDFHGSSTYRVLATRLCSRERDDRHVPVDDYNDPSLNAEVHAVPSKLEKLSAADIAVQMSSEFMTEVETDALEQGDDTSDRRSAPFSRISIGG